MIYDDFMMIYDDSWWFMMIYDDFMMIYDDSWWFMMIYDDFMMILWWFMMIYDDLWWFMMIYDDLWWFMMIYDVQPLIMVHRSTVQPWLMQLLVIRGILQVAMAKSGSF